MTEFPPTMAARKDSAGTSLKLVLLLLFLFNVMNFLDRMLFAILQEPIKRDLGLSDFELGILGGPAFAILYAIAALPIARFADRQGRVNTIVGVLTLWSLFTAWCGAAGNYLQLLAGRTGVSLGEAGCAPSAHSLLSDYFPPERRSGAIAIFTSGTSLGTLSAALIGGRLAQAYGWRFTFFLCGGLGLLLALAIRFALREPQRSKSSTTASLGVIAVARKLFAVRTYRHLCAGMTIATLSGFAAVQYLTSFLIRQHHISLSQAAGLTGMLVGGVGFFATIVAGIAVDRHRRRFPRLPMLLPASAVLLSGGAYWVAFATDDFAVAITALVVAVIGMQGFLGPGFALAQNLSPPAIRTTAAGLLMLIIGLVGYAIGSPMVGAVSDYVASGQLHDQGLTLQACTRLVDDGRCASAQASGLRAGLLAVTWPMAWASLHFWFASRTMEADAAAVEAVD